MFTSGRFLVFDHAGDQLPAIQRILNRSPTPEYLSQCLASTDECYLARFREWMHEIPKKEMGVMLGVWSIL